MTNLLLRAIRHNPDIRVSAGFLPRRRPLAQWVVGDYVALLCVWHCF